MKYAIRWSQLQSQGRFQNEVIVVELIRFLVLVITFLLALILFSPAS